MFMLDDLDHLYQNALCTFPFSGGDFVLGLSCEFAGDADVCVCTFVGCLAQKSDVGDASSCASSDRECDYDDIVDDIEMAMEQEFAGFDSSDSVESEALFAH